jgi:hypothetical protein
MASTQKLPLENNNNTGVSISPPLKTLKNMKTFPYLIVSLIIWLFAVIILKNNLALENNSFALFFLLILTFNICISLVLNTENNKTK